jgi:hypothetical protein
MTSPSETARDYRAGPEDDQNMPELNWDPAGARLEGDPRSPAPATSGYPGVTAVGSAAAEPGLAGRDDAAAPFASSASSASLAAQPGSAPQCLWPGTAQARAHAGKGSSRCSSMIRAHLLS